MKVSANSGQGNCREIEHTADVGIEITATACLRYLRPNGRPYTEIRGSHPDGNHFDISEHGFLDVQPLGEKDHSKPNG